MLHSFGTAAVFAAISKHAIGGIIAIVVGVIAIGFGLLRTAMRAVMLFAGVAVVVIGVLLATRAI